MAGAWIYAQAVPAGTARGRNILWGFVGLLSGLQVYANFGPPPASESMAIMALVFYLILATIAALVERLRLAP